MSTDRLLLVDGNNVHARAMHASNGRVALSASGINTSALLLSINMLSKYVRLVQPTHTLVAFDRGYDFRTEIIPEYKANRREKRTEEKEAFIAASREERDLFEMVCREMGFDVFSAPGYEADDVIALAHRYWTGDISIVSGDRDLLQLLAPGVVQYQIPADVPTTHETFEAAYGYPPTQSPHMKALQGDSSDNLTGVPGLGPKKALALMEKHGWDWDQVLDSLDEEHRDIAERTLEVVDLQVAADRMGPGVRAEPLPFPSPNETLQDVLVALEMHSVLDRLSRGTLWAPEPDADMGFEAL